MNWFNSVSNSLLTKSLDGLWMRESAISQNIANYETPGYKRKYISFEEQLKSQLNSKNTSRSEVSNNILTTKPFVGEAQDESLRLDGNNVDVEKENIEMARTQLAYAYATRTISDQFSRLRTVINDGRK